MEPTDVDRRFADLIKTEFGESVARPAAKRPLSPRPAPPTQAVTPSKTDTPASQADDVAGWAEDYRVVPPRPRISRDLRIAGVVLGAGLLILLASVLLPSVPAAVVWVAPTMVVASLSWLMIRALRRPPRDPMGGTGAQH